MLRVDQKAVQSAARTVVLMVVQWAAQRVDRWGTTSLAYSAVDQWAVQRVCSKADLRVALMVVLTAGWKAVQSAAPRVVLKVDQKAAQKAVQMADE